MRMQVMFVGLAALLLLTAGCGKSPDEVTKEDAAKKLDDAGKQMEQAAKDMEEAARKGGEGLAAA
ncbi:MAG: hypothetical protein KAX84_20490, partial [Burkholderiales bacterium]|nr:hypothetical protein [Burkholderiales bacterium]